MSTAMPRELTIMPAKNGGFIVLEFPSDMRQMTVPLFAGSLDEGLAFMKQAFTPDADSKAEG